MKNFIRLLSFLMSLLLVACNSANSVSSSVSAPPPTPYPTFTPSPIFTPLPIPTNTSSPTSSPSPTFTPTFTPSPEPTFTPSPEPTSTPSPESTSTFHPTETPTTKPSPTSTSISENTRRCITRDNQEAEEIVRFLSGKIFIAEDNIYHQVKSDLAAIRSSYGKDFDALNHIQFRLPWVPSDILIRLDDFTMDAVANDEYHTWDELNQRYGVTEVRKVNDNWNLYVLTFECPYDPQFLSEEYIELPGIFSAIPNGVFADGPRIYPRQNRNQITYLFMDAWGDCLSGCISREFWYFTFDEQNQPMLVGHRGAQNGEEPSWWNEAKQNIEEYQKRRAKELFEQS